MLIAPFGWVQWECKWLAQQVKWDFSPEEREEMFLAWNIHRESKQRKLQLIKRLWSTEILRLESDPLRRATSSAQNFHKLCCSLSGCSEPDC